MSFPPASWPPTANLFICDVAETAADQDIAQFGNSTDPPNAQDGPAIRVRKLGDVVIKRSLILKGSTLASEGQVGTTSLMFGVQSDLGNDSPIAMFEGNISADLRQPIVIVSNGEWRAYIDTQGHAYFKGPEAKLEILKQGANTGPAELVMLGRGPGGDNKDHGSIEMFGPSLQNGQPVMLGRIRTVSYGDSSGGSVAIDARYPGNTGMSESLRCYPSRVEVKTPIFRPSQQTSAQIAAMNASQLQDGDLVTDTTRKKTLRWNGVSQVWEALVTASL